MELAFSEYIEQKAVFFDQSFGLVLRESHAIRHRVTVISTLFCSELSIVSNVKVVDAANSQVHFVFVDVELIRAVQRLNSLHTGLCCQGSCQTMSLMNVASYCRFEFVF